MIQFVEVPTCVVPKPLWGNGDKMTAWVLERLEARKVKRINRLFREILRCSVIKIDPKTPYPAFPSEMRRHIEARLAEVLMMVKGRPYFRVEEICTEDIVHFDDDTRCFVHWVTKVFFTLKEALEAAEEGNLEPLLQEYPWLARFHIRPRRGHGKRRHTPNWRAEAAARDVYFIRRLWRCAYNGRWKRGRSNPPTAEQIAADFWNVDVRSVESRVRH